jgi:hypothetical protein
MRQQRFWPNRDPLAEIGIQLRAFKTLRAFHAPFESLFGANVYAYADNDGIDEIDPWGMAGMPPKGPPGTWPPKPPPPPCPPNNINQKLICELGCAAAGSACYAFCPGGRLAPWCYATCGVLETLCQEACQGLPTGGPPTSGPPKSK